MSSPSPLRTAGWGVFCASSWTWCIGMYLPVLLMQRWGVAGFIAFTVPNVVGLAAFGYVLRTPEASRRLLERHAAAAAWFSAITVAFHVFFAGFVAAVWVGADDGAWGRAFIAPAALLVLGLALALPDRWWPWLAALVYAVSLAVFVRLGLGGWTRTPTPTMSTAQLAWVTPSLVFGFLLCPYLDLTFHRALRRAGSPHAFAVFGVTFLVMLLLTVALWFNDPGVLPAIGLAHLGAQAVFTVAAHLREWRLSPVPACPYRRGALMGGAAVLGAIALLILMSANTDRLDLGNEIYLRFMVFYGLVFPAYVLLFMTTRRAAAPTRRGLLVGGAIVLLSMPAYELGFLHGMTWLLIVPLGVLGGAWLLRRTPPRRP